MIFSGPSLKWNSCWTATGSWTEIRQFSGIPFQHCHCNIRCESEFQYRTASGRFKEKVSSGNQQYQNSSTTESILAMVYFILSYLACIITNYHYTLPIFLWKTLSKDNFQILFILMFLKTVKKKFQLESFPSNLGIKFLTVKKWL